MSYVHAVERYEAAQLVDGQQAAFIAMVDPNGSHTWTQNPDGSLYVRVNYQPRTIQVTNWWISNGYYGAFPGWDPTNYSGIVTDPDFILHYSVG